ncbi:MAG: AMP-binding protein [Myxococcota bacterium]
MANLPDYRILDPGVERASKPELRRLQSERLRAMVHYVYAATPFWRRKFDAIGLKPEAIRGVEDLERIPFCTKEELLDDQEANPPFGSYVASHPSRWRKYLTTSGTTGTPLRRVFSGRDWEYVLAKFQRNPTLGPGDIAVVLGPMDGLMGPTASAEAAGRCGAMVVLAGLYDTRTRIRLVGELRPTTVSGTTSYLLHMLEVAAEMGISLAEAGVRVVTCVGEPGGAVPATRKRLAEGWGAVVADGYGLTELFPLGGGCPHRTSLHIPDDLVVTEIVDPEGDRRRVSGEPGEVVYTNLVGDTQPLLRFRTRDVARIATDERCDCGFTGTLLAESIEGRVDDLIWYRGVNVYPPAVEAVVRGFAELTPEYQIVVEGDGALPTMTVRAEVREDVETSELPALEDRVADALRETLGVRPRVELLARGALPRAGARAKPGRVVDRRRTQGGA